MMDHRVVSDNGLIAEPGGCAIDIRRAEIASTCRIEGREAEVAATGRITVQTVPGTTHFLPMERPDVVRDALFDMATG